MVRIRIVNYDPDPVYLSTYSVVGCITCSGSGGKGGLSSGISEVIGVSRSLRNGSLRSTSDGNDSAAEGRVNTGNVVRNAPSISMRFSPLGRPGYGVVIKLDEY